MVLMKFSIKSNTKNKHNGLLSEILNNSFYTQETSTLNYVSFGKISPVRDLPKITKAHKHKHTHTHTQ